MYKPLEQIEKEYNGQWVFMINCNKNERGTVIGGEVVLFSKKLSDLTGKTAALDKGPGISSVRYVGDFPEGTAFL